NESSSDKVSARRLPQRQLARYLDSLYKQVSAPLAFGIQQYEEKVSGSDKLSSEKVPQEAVSMATIKVRKLKQQAASQKAMRQALKKRWLDLSYEYWKRTSVPFYALLFILIGLSLGAILQKGGIGLPALISIALVVILHLMNVQAKKLMRSETVSPELAAWLPILLFVPVAVYFLSRVLKK
ncbi:MAG: LptF/LptG family permease, partial [Bacteroidota bacterium]